MSQDSLFIVVEGLDGSGKTTVTRELAYFLQASFKGKVKSTFEPHDPSCGGLFIRQILTKKIKNFSQKTLALIFAANRLDHCDREINEWLNKEKNRIIICDRYYLSSLVYQSSEGFYMENVMNLNDKARKPDIIFFLNVSNKVCFERMKIRNEPKGLFEKNLTDSRKKYFSAIEFLRKNRQENIIEIDGNGTIEESLSQMEKAIYDFDHKWKSNQLEIFKNVRVEKLDNFSLNEQIPITIDDIVKKLTLFTNQCIETIEIDLIKLKITNSFDNLKFNELGLIFLDYIKTLGYTLREKLQWTHLNAYKLEYQMPGNILQSGSALLINKSQGYNVILSSIQNLRKMMDFMFVFFSGPSKLVTKYYERDKIKNSNNEEFLFPSVQIVTQKDLEEFTLRRFLKDLSNKKLSTSKM